MPSSAKQKVAEALAARVQDGMVLALGSGSTAELAIKAIGERVKSESLSLSALSTSEDSSRLAEEAGIKILDPLQPVEVDFAFDGADEVDEALNLTKGGGGKLLKEKIIARLAGELVIIVTADKLVEKLGQTFPIPVEFVPSAQLLVERGLSELGFGDLKLRMGAQDKPFVTESGNFIFDAVHLAAEPESLEQKVNAITGVVDNGLFVGLTKEVLVATEGEDSIRVISPKG